MRLRRQLLIASVAFGITSSTQPLWAAEPSQTSDPAPTQTRSQSAQEAPPPAPQAVSPGETPATAPSSPEEATPQPSTTTKLVPLKPSVGFEKLPPPPEPPPPTADENSKIRSILNSSSPSTFAPQSVSGEKQAPATVTGKVTDISGKKTLAEAHILLIKEGEEHKRSEAETKADGLFTLSDLEPGNWSMTVSAPNMLSQSNKLELTAGETRNLNIMLEDLEAEDVLRVTGKRSLIHPEKIGSTTNVDHDTIYQYKSGNDLRQIIESTPGVITDTFGNIIVRGEHNSINYNLDGVILPEAAGVLQQTQFVTPRSLQSMQVDIGGYQAADGGGPLGAVVRMKSLPIEAKPTFTIGQQIGGPISGNIYYNASGAFSQDSKSVLNRLRYDSSGSFMGTQLGLSPPTRDFVHDSQAQINSLTKLEFLATERDTFKLTVGINDSFSQIPTSAISYDAGVRQHQHDRQDYIILSYKHRFERFFDEGNLHIINAFYDETYSSRNVFDPDPVINGGQPLISIAPSASRFDYVFGSQGNLIKTIRNTHRVELGFLSELRAVRTDYGGTYYNANPNLPGVPFGAVISPFTGLPGGLQFTKQMGEYKGSRLLESAYLQDSWRPTKGFLKRLTLDGGARVDVYHGVFGGTQQVEQALQSIPGVPAFSSSPFQPQHVTDAQVSGRYGASFVIDPHTVIRASYSNIFEPPSVDVFSTPPLITQEVNGVFNGTVRPMRATRGQLVDTSLERQIGPRFMTRTNLFYKQLHNFGDSGVIGNTPLYNRQTISGQNAYGVETRVELKKSRDGYGFNGFISNTMQIALLSGSKQVTGGIYDIQTTPIEDKYPDHDRRESVVAALGYASRQNWWILGDYNFLSGLQDERDPALVGPHPFRTPWLNIFDLSCGFKTPKELMAKYRYLPDTVDCRLENLFNNRLPTNLGSPFQGTRYLQPFHFLIGCSWHFGQQQFKMSQTKSNQTI
ncbi:MAG TPA: TonB-dependent receptor [Planktothrix sp.]|jgi:hypothetical protein